jgi:GAF domain-containing protein
MADMARLHQELAQVVLAGRDLDTVLGEMTTIARRALPGSEATSITLIRNEKPFTAAHDGQMALDADEMQYRRDYGPCVDAGRSGQRFLIDDMRTEERWPDYARHAASYGIGSSLSIPLPFQAATIGALNNYSTHPHAFSEDDVALGEEVASWVATAVGNATLLSGAFQDAAHMRAAMATRSAIEQGKGILMERYKITPDAAFTLLSKASQHTGTKLRDVAEDLVRTGILPGSR